MIPTRYSRLGLDETYLDGPVDLMKRMDKVFLSLKAPCCPALELLPLPVLGL